MKKQHLIPIITIGVIVIAVLLLRAVGLSWPFRLVYDQVANPIGTRLVATRNTIGEELKFLTSIRALNSENKRLERSELDLRQQLAALKEVARENELLRAQLSFNARLNFELVPARVVSVEPDSTRKFITIDRGSASGIAKGQAVLSSGVLVGTIEEVNDYSAKVFLISDTDFRLRALGQDGRAQGIVRGQLGRGYLLDKVAPGEQISIGEQIVTTGSGLVPQGILIGTVDSIKAGDNAVFQSANLKPLVDLSSLELVFVVTGLKQ